MTEQVALLEKQPIMTSLEDWVIDVLVHKDGSTTQMIEQIVGDMVSIKVHFQNSVDQVELPMEIRHHFSASETVLHRVTSLHYQSTPLTYNAVYADLSILPKHLIGGLESGSKPIGKLIQEVESRRDILWFGYENKGSVEHLFTNVILPDGVYPMKQYVLVHNDHPWFLICEVFDKEALFKFFWNNIGSRKVRFDRR